jgi:saposin
MIVAKETPDAVCTKLNACSPSAGCPYADSLSNGGDQIECGLCALVFSEVDQILANDRTIQTIENVLNSVCSKFGPMEAMCDALVNTETPKIVAWLAEKVDPKTICERLGLCPPSDEMNIAVIVDVAPDAVGGDIECAVCTLAMTVVEHFLAGNYSEAKIEEALQDVCSKLPSELQSLCTSLVNQYTDPIIQFLEQKFPPATICQKIGLCSSSMDAAISFPAVEIDVQVDGEIECDVCTLAMSLVEHLLAGNYSESKIESTLDEVCALLPSSLQSMCTSLISEYTDPIIQFLEQKYPPAEICQKINICNASMIAEPMPMPMPMPAELKANTLECELCKLVFGEIERIVGSNSTEEKIMDAMDKVCNVLPSALTQECVTFVALYGPQAIQYLLNKESPPVICYELTLCSQPTVEEPTTVTNVDDSNLECDVCEIVITLAEKILAGNTTETAIEAALEKVCTLLPKDGQPMCEQFIETEWPVLVYFLSQKATPQEVCTVVKACPKTTYVRTEPAVLYARVQ